MYRYDLEAMAWEELEADGEPDPISYFGSIIRDGNWIFFPGWNGFKNTD